MKQLKMYLKPLFTGIALTLILALIMLKVTMNFQLLLFIGAVLFFFSGLINAKTSANKIIGSILISMLYVTLFGSLVLTELPSLFYFIPIFYMSCLLGLYFSSNWKRVTITSSVLIVVMLILAIKIIPASIESNLTKLKFEPLPSFEFTNLNGTSITTSQLQGKIVVLDFFGTWCAPCRKELPELAKVKQEFQNEPDVIFYVINADIGGDTPEKFKTFIEDHNYDFNYVYDTKSKVYKLLQLERSGLPALMIIDKKQNIRMLHVGYNEAETSFSSNLIEFIKELQ